jgi:hypothetical protein
MTAPGAGAASGPNGVRVGGGRRYSGLAGDEDNGTGGGPVRARAAARNQKRN